MENYVKPNGCYAESGYDFFEQQVKEEFEEYSLRKGYDITRDKEYSFFYTDGRTEDAWRMYRVAHVKSIDIDWDKVEYVLYDDVPMTQEIVFEWKEI